MSQWTDEELHAQIQYRLTEALAAARKRYRDFAENLRDIIFECDRQWRLIYVNAAWKEFFGDEAGSPIGRPIGDFIPLSDALAMECVSGGRQEVQLCREDVGACWFEVTMWPGGIDGIVGILHDDTDRRQAKQAFEEHHRQLTREYTGFLTIFATVPIAMLIVDQDWQVTHYNAAARAFSPCVTHTDGDRPGDFLACSKAANIPKDARDWFCQDCALQSTIQQVLTSKIEVRDVETRICQIRADGEAERYCSINASNLILDGRQHVLLALVDITERRQMETELRENEQNFRNFLETISEMIFIGDAEGRVIWANSAATERLGYSSTELRGMTIPDLHRTGDRQAAEQVLQQMLQGERQYCPLPLVGKDGRLVPAETRVWHGEWNRQKALYGISKDLTHQHAALEMFEKVFEANPTPMALTNITDRRIEAVNGAFCTLTKFAKSELIGKSSADLGLFTNMDEFRRVAVELERCGRIRNIAMTLRTKAGQLLHGLFFGEIVESQGRRLFLTTMVDITTQKQIEEELRASQEDLERRVLARTAELHAANRALTAENEIRRNAEAMLEVHRQQLRQLASRLVLSEEEQRRELAMQLHDSIGQELAMVRLRLDRLARGLSPELASNLDAASGLLNSAIQDVRDLTHGLGATVLHELGLPAALRSLGKDVSTKYEIELSYSQQGDYRRPSKEVEVQAFRAARELVFNVLKHASASRLEIALEARPAELAIVVVDNGRGFVAEPLQSGCPATGGGFGLFSIRECLINLGGRLELESSAGQGTHARVVIPCRPPSGVSNGSGQ